MLVNNIMVFCVLVASALALPSPDPKQKNKDKKSKKNKNKNDSPFYACTSSAGEYDIEQAWATAAVTEGGPVEGANAFPFIFTTTNQFPNADPRCNEPDVQLLSYPVSQDGTLITKAQSADPTTPARVAYLKADGTTICGVVSHVTEAEDGRGSGDLIPCQF